MEDKVELVVEVMELKVVYHRQQDKQIQVVEVVEQVQIQLLLVVKEL
jgi:hypothetical protein